MSSWTTYQLYMMCLSIALVLALFGAEFFLRKFEIIHVIYNQMLRLKERRLICFNQFDVTDNYEIVSSAVMMTRLTIVLVICYIWQFCVLESYAFTDSTFPSSICNPTSTFECFQTPLRWDSFLVASTMTPIDCSKGAAGFVPIADSFGVGCFRTIPQNAAAWLQTLAIGNALGLFTTRIYEVLVWLCFSSLASLIGFTLLLIASAVAVVASTLLGYFSSFSNSWLGFIAMAIFPFILFVVRSAAVELRQIHRREMKMVQQQAKADFAKIASEFASNSEMTVGGSVRSAESNNSAESQEGLRQRSGGIQSG
jgi:hypothetical protein